MEMDQKHSKSCPVAACPVQLSASDKAPPPIPPSNAQFFFGSPSSGTNSDRAQPLPQNPKSCSANIPCGDVSVSITSQSCANEEQPKTCLGPLPPPPPSRFRLSGKSDCRLLYTPHRPKPKTCVPHIVITNPPAGRNESQCELSREVVVDVLPKVCGIPCSGDGPIPLPKKISLESSLPSFDVCVDPMDHKTEYDKLKTKWPVHGIIHEPLPWDDVHPFTKVAQHMIRPVKVDHSASVFSVIDAEGLVHIPSAVDIFSDGTHSALGTAWAILIIVTLVTGELCYLGYMGGKVVCEPNHPQYIGAEVADNFTAEVSGCVWGQVWATQFKFSPSTVIASRIDCISAAAVVFADQFPKANELLVSVGGAVLQTLKTLVEVVWVHVKGHSGHPWNEGADRIAAHIADDTAFALRYPFPAHDWVLASAHSIKLSADLFVGTYDGTHYPPRNGSSFIISTPLAPTNGPFSSAATIIDAPKPMPSGVSILFELLQCYVTTLAPSHVGKSQNKGKDAAEGRVAFLQHIFYKAGLNVIGLEEARTAGPRRPSQIGGEIHYVFLGMYEAWTTRM